MVRGILPCWKSLLTTYEVAQDITIIKSALSNQVERKLTHDVVKTAR